MQQRLAGDSQRRWRVRVCGSACVQVASSSRRWCMVACSHPLRGKLGFLLLQLALRQQTCDCNHLKPTPSTSSPSANHHQTMT